MNIVYKGQCDEICCFCFDVDIWYCDCFIMDFIWFFDVFDVGNWVFYQLCCINKRYMCVNVLY